MIRAIVFDAFGTLIRYGGQRLNPYRRLLKGRTDGDSRAERLPFLTRNVPAATFAAELGIEHVMTDFERELADEVAGLRLFDEVPHVLRRAHDAGLGVAVCSNLAAEYGAPVRRLLPDLDAHILSFEIGVAKPSHVIYKACCEALNCRPCDVLFIGDSPRCDVRGPQGFGMQGRLLDRASGQTLADVAEGVL